MIGNGSIRVDVAGPKLATIPRHIGMIPGQPRQTGTIRADLRRGIEVIAGDKHLRFASGERDCDDAIDSLAIILPVIFADANQTTAALINHEVRITKLSIRTSFANQLRL